MVYQGLQKTVALVGMMGAGKTAIGKALAARLSVPFLDSDAEIVTAANMSVAEIFERDGEPFFRQKESQVIERLLKEERAVLSTGGGAFLSAANQKMISQHGVSVWLKVDLEILWSRVKHKDTRPLLRTDNPYETLKDLLAQRMPSYEKADVIVEAEPHLSIEDMCDKVVAQLAAHGGIVLQADQDAATADLPTPKKENEEE